jgi:hypothetical protein
MAVIEAGFIPPWVGEAGGRLLQSPKMGVFSQHVKPIDFIGFIGTPEVVP